jgi:hypothetical protein
VKILCVNRRPNLCVVLECETVVVSVLRSVARRLGILVCARNGEL